MVIMEVVDMDMVIMVIMEEVVMDIMEEVDMVIMEEVDMDIMEEEGMDTTTKAITMENDLSAPLKIRQMKEVELVMDTGKLNSGG